MKYQKTKQRQEGSAHVVIVICLVAALLFSLGWIFWQNFVYKEPVKKNTELVVVENEKKVKPSCETGDSSATTGVFCDMTIGVRFTVPSIFKGQLKKVPNYKIIEKTSTTDTGKTTGQSIAAYEATISDPAKGSNASAQLKIAREPMHSGDGAPYRLCSTFFDKDNQTMRTSSNCGNTTVPTVVIDGVKFFDGTIADAGVATHVYFGIVSGDIVRIELTTHAYMGPENPDAWKNELTSTQDEFTKSIKNLEVLDD